MVVFESHTYQIMSCCPDSNFIHPDDPNQPKWIVPDDSELANKIKNTPLWSPVVDSDGNLVDIVEETPQISNIPSSDSEDEFRKIVEIRDAAIIQELRYLKDRTLFLEFNQGAQVDTNSFTIKFDTGVASKVTIAGGTLNTSKGQLEFTNSKSVVVTLKTPYERNTLINAFSIKIEGLVPNDAICKYEVTNNANDLEPAWEDFTDRIKLGYSSVISNRQLDDGKCWAFNFRISISGANGYISKISGAFSDDEGL